MSLSHSDEDKSALRDLQRHHEEAARLQKMYANGRGVTPAYRDHALDEAAFHEEAAALLARILLWE